MQRDENKPHGVGGGVGVGGGNGVLESKAGRSKFRQKGRKGVS